MARRFTPFYQSLANRGMKNTNKSIGNLNTFPGNSYGFENQGGGNTYKPFPDTGFEQLNPPTKWSTPPYLSPPDKYGESPSSIMPGLEKPSPIDLFDYPSTGEDIPIKPPTDELPPGYEWRWINGNWQPFLSDHGLTEVPPQLGGIEVPGGNTLTPPNYLEEQEDTFTPPTLSPHEELMKSDAMAGGFDVNKDGQVDISDYLFAQDQTNLPNYEGIPDFAQWLQDTQYEGDASGFTDWWGGFTQEQQDAFSSTWQDEYQSQIEGQQESHQGFLENLLNYINKPQIAAQQFTGGGGQGGQAARQLYYPGTSGGFASVGSGFGGGKGI